MTRAEQRALKKRIRNDIKEFLKIQAHYFPELIDDIKAIMDARNQSYITYEIEVIIFVMILKNICSIESMQEMNEVFNEDTCVKNIYKVLGLEEKDYLPHYVTINECLSRLDNIELEKIRKKMIYGIIRKRSFEYGKFLGEKWLVIVDATQLFSFRERHCEHCLTKTIHKGTEEEKTIYYHQVLEAKLVLGDDMIVSLATEFIENTRKNATKQDCELNSFKRLAESVKKEYPRLPICLLADSLYANDTVFEICRKNKWEFLIRYKEGSIPSIMEEYREITEMGEACESVIEKEEIYQRKPNRKQKLKINWVNGIEYKKHPVHVLELKIEREGKKYKEFRWLSSMEIEEEQVEEFVKTGRKRWLIENEGFNIQKNHRYIITHANSMNYNAMKNHYLITQIADIMMQMYENGDKGIKELKYTIKRIAEELLESLRKQKLESEELVFKRMQVRRE